MRAVYCLLAIALLFGGGKIIVEANNSWLAGFGLAVCLAGLFAAFIVGTPNNAK